MECSGGCASLIWGEGLSHAQPREGEPDGGHCGAESVGGRPFELGCRAVGGLGCGPARTGLAGCGFGGGCCGHRFCDLLEGWMEGPAAQTADRLVAAQA